MAKPAVVTAKDIRNLLASQNFRCAYTGDELTPDNLTADHHVPVSRGGCHELSNIRLVTEDVNRAKGTMFHGEFVDICRKVVVTADRSTEADPQAAESLAREWLA